MIIFKSQWRFLVEKLEGGMDQTNATNLGLSLVNIKWYFVFFFHFSEHADPSFEVHAPYVKECQKMPGYISVTIRNCMLFHAFSLHSIQVCKNGQGQGS